MLYLRVEWSICLPNIIIDYLGAKAQNDNEPLQKLNFILGFVYNIQLMMALTPIFYLTLG
jgi:hypothetical protein